MDNYFSIIYELISFTYHILTSILQYTLPYNQVNRDKAQIAFKIKPGKRPSKKINI